MDKWFQSPPNWPTHESKYWTRRPAWAAPPLILQFKNDPPRWIDTFTATEFPISTITKFKAPTPPVQPYTLEVTGAITPDFTGLYTHKGLFDGQQYFKHETLDAYIFYVSAASAWALAAVALPYPADYWTSFAQPDPSSIVNLYDPSGSYSGVATIAEP
jgi:hypothetical protein